ncbi:hypothetical protein ZWY2020_028686 [Hordeum vulgare]|nr:hypothetical protein ZWY2020_028686 [Hordeum vulgare]
MAMAALVVLSLLLLPTGEAQERRSVEAHPHGLPFESPLALSPAAYEFFHPSERARRVDGAPELSARAAEGSVVRGAGASAASVARADQEEGVAPVNTTRQGGAVRAGVVAGVFVGAAVVVLAARPAYAVARRRVGVAQGDAEMASAHKSNA